MEIGADLLAKGIGRLSAIRAAAEGIRRVYQQLRSCVQCRWKTEEKQGLSAVIGGEAQ